MPDEILIHIFEFLDDADLCHVGMTAADIYRVANDNLLWRSLTLARYPFCGVDNVRNWKRAYSAVRRMQLGWNAGRPKDFKMNPLRGHANYVSCFALLKKMVVSGSADNTLKVCLWRVCGVC